MRRLVPCAVLLLCVAAAADAQVRTLQLSIGDPARRDRNVPVVLDGIVDTATGDLLTPGRVAERLASTKLLLVGESHTSIEFHRAQLQIIRALHDAGRDVMIGLEMFPYTEQRSLDHWHEGLLTEAGFVRLSQWYEHWGYHWRYYRDIFLYARDQGLRMYAVNSPRDVVTAVRRKGLQNLTAEEAAHIPADIDVDDEDHMAFFKASFDADDMLHGGMSDEAWQGMLSAQATWDATMGYNAVQALARHGRERSIMVVLVGSGHVAYGVGIERQARRWFDGGIATLIPVPVAGPDDQPIHEVRASYANFVWGVPGESATMFPALGISTRGLDDGRRQVIHVERRSIAAKAGFAVDDVLVSMDGRPVRDREALNDFMATKHWGDSATFVVRRGETEQTLTAVFRREAPATEAGACR